MLLMIIYAADDCGYPHLNLSWRPVKSFSQVVAAGMLLVDTQMKTLRRPASLPDFLHTQEDHLSDVVDALRSDWLLKVCFLANGMHLLHCMFWH